MTTERLTKDECWMLQALVNSMLATCDRLRTGVIFVDENDRQISGGRNGSLPGEPHCDEVGHLIIDGHCMRTLHGEKNGIIYATRDLNNSTMYTVASPCFNCFMDVIAVGTKRIVYMLEFRNMHGRDKGWEHVLEVAQRKGVTIEHMDHIGVEELWDKGKETLRRPGGALNY